MHILKSLLDKKLKTNHLSQAPLVIFKKEIQPKFTGLLAIKVLLNSKSLVFDIKYATKK